MDPTLVGIFGLVKHVGQPDSIIFRTINQLLLIVEIPQSDDYYYQLIFITGTNESFCNYFRQDVYK